MQECVLVASEKEGSLFLLEARRGAVLRTFKGCNARSGALCVIAGHSSFQGVGGAGDYIYAAQDKRATVNVWSWANSNVQLQCHVQEIMTCLCAHPSGQYVFGGSRSGKIYVWQSSSGALVRTVNAHYRGITRCKASSCGTYLVTASEDSTVCVWSASDLVEIPTDHAPAIRAFKTFSVHSLPVFDVCILGAGPSARIATASADRTVKILQLCSGETLQTLTFPTAILVCAMNHTEDTLLAGGENGTIYAVDMHATAVAASLAHTRVHGKSEGFLSSVGQPNMHALTGHEGAVTSLAVSSDNITCVSGSSDATVRVWDLETRQCVNVAKPHSNAISDIVLVPRPDILTTAVNKPTLMPIHPLRKYADNAGDLDRHRILLTPVDVDAVPVFEAEEETTTTSSAQKRGRTESADAQAPEPISTEDEEDGFLSLPKAAAVPTRSLREALVAPHIDRSSSANGVEPSDAAATSRQELEELRQQIQELNTENDRWRTVAKKLKGELDAAKTAAATQPQAQQQADEEPVSPPPKKTARTPARSTKKKRVDEPEEEPEPAAAPTPAATPARSTRKTRKQEVETSPAPAADGETIATRLRARRKSVA